MAKITEGYMPFHGYQTYYRIVGEQKDNGKAPLICLHGGPGSTHNYYEVLDNVADDDDRMIVMYDQLGCGKSYLDGHPEMWTQDLWLDELDALREHLGLKECHIIRTVMGRNDADCICHRAWSRRGKILHHFFRTSKQQPVGKRRYA